jgi:hypothetical protein
MFFPGSYLFVFPPFSINRCFASHTTTFSAIYQIHVTSGYVTNLANREAKSHRSFIANSNSNCCSHCQLVWCSLNCKISLCWQVSHISAKKAQITQERVEYNVFLTFCWHGHNQAGFFFHLWQCNQILKWHWRPEFFVCDSIICFKIKNPPTLHSTSKIQPTTSPTFVFSVFESVRKSWGYEIKLLTVVLVVVHRVF